MHAMPCQDYALHDAAYILLLVMAACNDCCSHGRLPLQAWTNGATVCPQDVRGAAARSSEEGWVFVKKPGVKGVAQVKLPRVSTESRTEETINPLREHIETKQL